MDFFLKDFFFFLKLENASIEAFFHKTFLYEATFRSAKRYFVFMFLCFSAKVSHILAVLVVQLIPHFCQKDVLAGNRRGRYLPCKSLRTKSVFQSKKSQDFVGAIPAKDRNYPPPKFGGCVLLAHLSLQLLLGGLRLFSRSSIRVVI